MRLRELDATFVGDWRPGGYRRLESMQGAQGLLFQCPQCAIGKPKAEDGCIAGDHYVLCWFANPIGAAAVPASAIPGPGRWTFSGASIDDAMLSPSVNCDTHPTISHPGDCHWHGYVRNGEAS